MSPASCQVDVRISACALMLLFTAINYRGIEFSGRLQNAFMFFFWGASTLWFVMELKHIDFANFASVFGGLPGEVTAFAKLIVMVWWCFAGFETVVSIVAYAALSVFAVEWTAIWYNLGLSAICLAYLVFGVIRPRKRPPAESADVELLAFRTREPTAGERAELDAQYRLWKRIAIVAAALGAGLFALGFALAH